MKKLLGKRGLLIPVIAIAMLVVLAGSALASPRLWDQFPTTSRGDTSRRTTLIQRILYEIPGYFTSESSIDTDFGPATENQVITYQQNHSLQVDGIVGPQTWASFESKLENARLIGLGTGVYKINYDVDGHWCVQVLATQQTDGTTKYEWMVLDRFGDWKTVTNIYSTIQIFG